jgi:serine protease
VWVSYANGRSAEVRQALKLARAGFHYDFPELGAYVVTLPAAAADGIRHNSHVVQVEEDPVRYPIAATPSTESREALAGLDTMDPDGDTVPYGVDMVQARDVWDPDRNGVPNYSLPAGANRTVCIIDSGYYQDHEDLPAAGGGYSQVDDNALRDGYGHGTHVGGTIAAQNNGLGVLGVTPGTLNFYIVKIFKDDGTWDPFASNLVDALNRCVLAGANVVNMSLGGSTSSTFERRAFDDAYTAGVLSVAAAGNAGTAAVSYPAGYASVVSVAAVDSSKVVASFSQYNADVELAAPGVAVRSTLPYTDTNSLTTGGVTYSANHVDYSARGTASGTLANGGLCGTAGAWTGMVVLCARGTYDFYTKVQSVQSGWGTATRRRSPPCP